MRILIDTNVILDYLVKREPYYEAADKIFTLCGEPSLQGTIAAHSVTNCFYILRSTYSINERRELLLNICNLVDIVGVNRNILLSALNNEAFEDFEDSVQSECASDFGADYIVTRNIKDFAHSSIPAILPEDLLNMLDN